jgi:lipopolysaccharide transport system permease protein
MSSLEITAAQGLPGDEKSAGRCRETTIKFKCRSSSNISDRTRGRILSKAAAIYASLGCAEAAGLAEFLDGARYWRVWQLLGARELRQRYARSKLGQFWLVLSATFMIAAMSMAWSVLSSQPVGELLPFIGSGFVIWTYFSQAITDCTMIFVSHGNFYRNQRMNFSISIFSVIYKNTIVFAHSLIIVAGLILFFRVPVNWYDLQIVPALLLTWITMLWAGYVIAMICVRYRDVVQLINSWLLVLFFVTPVLWKPDSIPPANRFIADYNPLAQFVELLRNPFLGEPVSTYAWLSALAFALGGALIACPLIARYRQRVIFWT